jgi:hypothetical protein
MESSAAVPAGPTKIEVDTLPYIIPRRVSHPEAESQTRGI